MFPENIFPHTFGNSKPSMVCWDAFVRQGQVDSDEVLLDLKHIYRVPSHCGVDISYCFCIFPGLDFKRIPNERWEWVEEFRSFFFILVDFVLLWWVIVD